MRLNNYLNESKEITKEDIDKISWLSLDRNIRHDAQYFSLDDIRVGSKFFELPNDEAQKGILLHEIGHYISDQLLGDGKVWEWFDKGYFIGDFNGRKVEGINGKTIPGEVISEAYSIFWLEPKFLKTHYPELYKEFKTEVNKSKYNTINKMAKTVLNL